MRYRRNVRVALLVVLVTTLTFVFRPMKVQASDNPFDALNQVKDDITEVFQNMDTETAKEIFSFLKESIRNGSLDSKEDLQNAISEGREKFGFDIKTEDAQKIVDTMEKLEKMGFSAEDIITKTEKLYEKYGAGFMDHIEELLVDTVKDTAKTVVGNFFESMVKGIGSFFDKILITGNTTG